MKRFIYTVAVAAMLIATGPYVHAESQARPIYSTDIQTTLDGLPIDGYNIGGETLIILDDLGDYGFTVEYDDSIRTLLVNKTHSPSPDFHPQAERGVPRKIIGRAEETDIQAYVNGSYIETYTVNGKLAAIAEKLGDRTKFAGLTESSQYNMGYIYNDADRTLRIDTTPDDELSYDEKLSALYSYTAQNQDIYEITGIEKNVIDGADAVFVAQHDYDDKSKTITHFIMMYNDGHTIDMTGILDSAYGFGNFPYLTVFDGRLSDDKKHFLFYGERYSSTGMRSAEFIESGNYSMDILSGSVIKLD